MSATHFFSTTFLVLPSEYSLACFACWQDFYPPLHSFYLPTAHSTLFFLPPKITKYKSEMCNEQQYVPRQSSFCLFLVVSHGGRTWLSGRRVGIQTRRPWVQSPGDTGWGTALLSLPVNTCSDLFAADPPPPSPSHCCVRHAPKLVRTLKIP